MANLFGPVCDVGYCLRDENCAVDRLNWCDFGAPLMSGDTVMLFVRRSRGVAIALKILERTRDGQWWFTCWDTRDESSRVAHPLMNLDFGCLALPLLALAPVVRRVEIPRRVPRAPYVASRSEDFSAYLHSLGSTAIDEWREHGFMPRARLDYINTPENIERLHAGRSARPLFV